MKYAIIYSSKTGNTKLLADTIQKALSGQDCVFAGQISQMNRLDRIAQNTTDMSFAEILQETERVYVGFWTDRGSCDADTAWLLQQLRDKEVFLFGTAGFGGREAYFQTILQQVQTHLHDSNRVVDTFMCQGRMPYSVRQRYEKMQETGAISNAEEMIANYDKALSHPSADDLLALKRRL